MSRSASLGGWALSQGARPRGGNSQDASVRGSMTWRLGKVDTPRWLRIASMAGRQSNGLLQSCYTSGGDVGAPEGRSHRKTQSTFLTACSQSLQPVPNPLAL